MKPLAVLVASLAFVSFSGAAFAACNWSEKKPDQTAETPIILPPYTGT